MRSYFFLFLLLVGCGSSEAPVELSTPSDTEAPFVVTVLPEEGEDNEVFGTDATITYIFSETLRESTLGFRFGLVDESGDFIRSDGDRPYEISMVTQRIGEGTNLDTGIEIDRLVTAVSLTPPEDRLFPLNTRLGALPSREIRDLSDELVVDAFTGDEARGNLIASQDGNYIFLTRRGEWKPTGRLLCPESDSNVLRSIGAAAIDNVVNFQVSSGGDDNAIVAWVTSSQTDQIWVSNYDHNEGFISRVGVTPDAVGCGSSDFQPGVINGVPMAPSVVGPTSDLNVKRLPNRALFVSWRQFSSLTNSDMLFFNYFDGVTWLPDAQFLDPQANGSAISQFDLTVSDMVGSSMMLVWKQVSSDQSTVSYQSKLANLTSSNSSGRAVIEFEDSQTLTAVDSATSVSSNIATLPDRFLVLVGGQFSADQEVRSYEYSFSRESWETSSPINDVSDGVEFSDMAVGFDRNGDGFAIWSETNSGRKNLWFSRYFGREWNSSTDVDFPRKVENDDIGNIHSPALSVSRSGNAAIAWVQERSLDGDGDLLVRTFTADEPFFLSEDNWSFAELIDSNAGDVSKIDSVRLDHDFEGDLAMVWKSRNGGFLYAANLLRGDSSWVDPEIISTTSAAKDMILAPLFNDGRMLVVYDELEEQADTTDPVTGEVLIEGISERRLLKMTLFDEVD